jgi:4-hydroxy-3-polyprenylbenzoate decarboxylase
MACNTLHNFLAELELSGELHRVPVEVDPVLEIAEITDRVCKVAGGGQALLFERVRGCSLPVATNLYGTPMRMARALGVSSLEELTARSAEFLQHPERTEPSPLVAQAPCQERIESVPDLGFLPALQNWPGDGGRFLTLPLVITAHPETGAANCGLYRVRIFDRETAGIHWYPSSDGAEHYRLHGAAGQRMPVAIVLGASPALLLAASLPLPEETDEMAFAGRLQGEAVSLVGCVSHGLRVPADAELVIEGFLEPGETAADGAFGNHTGYYAPSAEVPVLHVTAITRRSDAVIPATVVGRPPMEDCWLAKAGERVMLPFLRREIPELVEINFPLEWIFHRAAVVSAAVTGREQARDVLERLWGSRWLRGARLIVLVDRDTDPRDLSGVTWKLMNRVDWRRDLIYDGPTPADTARMGWLPCGGGRLGVDVSSGAGTPEVVMDEAVVRQVSGRWSEYGL